MPDAEPMRWRIRAVTPLRSFVIDVPLDGATLVIQWPFEALAERCTRLTQRLSLSGPRAQAYRATIEASFGPTLVPGMEWIARELERADQKDRM
jgi:ABC-type iron transport system FetAB permease component